MGSRYLTIILISLSIQYTVAQSSLTFDKLFSVGIHLTKTEYSGELGNSIWNVKAGQLGSYWYYWGGGFSFSVNLNRSFFVSIDGNYGSYGYYANPYPGNNFLTNKLDFTTTGHYKLNNGYIFNEDGIIAPFFSLGVGIAKYFYTNTKLDLKYVNLGSPHRVYDVNIADFVFPVGGGIQFNISKDLAVRYQYLIYITSQDNHDNKHTKSGNDIYGQHMGSIIFSFGDVVRKDNCHCNF